MPLAVQAATAAIEKICPDAKNLLLMPENHTRNKWYLENVATLAAILRQTGLEVRIGSLNPEITAPTELETATGKKLLVEPLQRARQPARRRGLRSLRDPGQQRPVRRHPADPRGA